MSTREPDPMAVRAWFPALAGDLVFLENAGGSQVPRVVADGIRDYMLGSYVQLGAGYPLSRTADRVIEEAHAFTELLVNAGSEGRVALGPSSSQLVTMLAHCYADVLAPGDEVIYAESGHEANIGPWARLASRGVRVVPWRVDADSQACPLEGLRDLLTERTRIVAVTHVSNLLGGIVDVAAVSALAHEVRARVVVDGVAYAPHRAVDVQAWGVDWYVFSTYKVYGPHMAALYGRHDAFAELSGPNHFFVPQDEVPYKFELGGVNHEGCAGWLALRGYLAFLAGTPGEPLDRAGIEAAFETMTELELPLQGRLVSYLRDHTRVRFVGPAHAGRDRVPTVSFVHESLSSASIAAGVQERGFAIRHGHMYAHRLCTALGLDVEDGVVRISAVHYNTVDEIERLVGVLDEVL